MSGGERKRKRKIERGEGRVKERGKGWGGREGGRGGARRREEKKKKAENQD